MVRLLFLLTALVALMCVPVMGAAPMQIGDAPSNDTWTQAPVLFSATLEKVDVGPMGRSMPPMRTYTLHFAVIQALRGELKAGDKIAASLILRQEGEPVFDTKAPYLVAMHTSRGQATVTTLVPADDNTMQVAKLAAELPLGWQIGKDGIICPWTLLGDKAWPAANGDMGAKHVCKTTGRPALLAGTEVKFEVEKVPPAKEIEWTNPDGDGEFKITVTNSTDKPLVIPALLKQGDKVLWNECLVIECQGLCYMCPGAQGISGKVESVTLAAHESLSTTVNILALKGPQWPQGGERVEFCFCLGEKSQTMSFYYMSRHHDPLRAALNKADKQ